MAQAHDVDPNAALAAAIEGNQALDADDWKKEKTDDPNIIEKGRFAVDEKNRQLGGIKYVFDAVTSAESKTVAVVNYRLTISVKDERGTNLYDVRVLQNRNGTKELKSFEIVN